MCTLPILRHLKGLLDSAAFEVVERCSHRSEFRERVARMAGCGLAATHSRAYLSAMPRNYFTSPRSPIQHVLHVREPEMLPQLAPDPGLPFGADGWLQVGATRADRVSLGKGGEEAPAWPRTLCTKDFSEECLPLS